MQHALGLRVISPLHNDGLGSRNMDYVLPRSYDSCEGRCPAAISVIAAIASQDVIKAVAGTKKVIAPIISTPSCHCRGAPTSEWTRADDVLRVS